MNLGFGGFLGAVALLSTGVAVWAGDNFAVAVPAATVAVLAAGLLIADAALGGSRMARPPGDVAGPEEVGMLRAWFRSGRLGREAITELLDHLERAGPNPELPRRRAEEMSRLAQLPYAEFRSYVRQRLDDLESRT
jgi:hypothetical protein